MTAVEGRYVPLMKWKSIDSGRSAFFILGVAGMASLLFTRCSFFSHTDTTTPTTPETPPAQASSTIVPPVAPPPTVVSSSSLAPGMPPQMGSGGFPPGMQRPPTMPPFFSSLASSHGMPLPPPPTPEHSSSAISSLAAIPPPPPIPGTTTTKKKHPPAPKKTTVSVQWEKLTNATWSDVWENMVSLKDGKVQWSDDDGKTWSPSDGSWEGDNNVYYKIDSKDLVYSTANPRQGPWKKISNRSWVSGGQTYRIDSKGNIYLKKS